MFETARFEIGIGLPEGGLFFVNRDYICTSDFIFVYIRFHFLLLLSNAVRVLCMCSLIMWVCGLCGFDISGPYWSWDYLTGL